MDTIQERMLPCESCGHTWQMLEIICVMGYPSLIRYMMAAHSCDGIGVLATWTKMGTENIRVMAFDTESLVWRQVITDFADEKMLMVPQEMPCREYAGHE